MVQTAKYAIKYDRNEKIQKSYKKSFLWKSWINVRIICPLCNTYDEWVKSFLWS